MPLLLIYAPFTCKADSPTTHTDTNISLGLGKVNRVYYIEEKSWLIRKVLCHKMTPWDTSIIIVKYRQTIVMDKQIMKALLAHLQDNLPFQQSLPPYSSQLYNDNHSNYNINTEKKERILIREEAKNPT